MFQNLSHAEEQSEEVENYDVKSNHDSEGKHDIDLPSVTASLTKDLGTGKKGSYTPMTPVSEASTSITAIAELNEKEILLPRFDLSEDPQITKETEFEYISRELALNHSSEKQANVLSVQENGESNTVYAGILGNNSEDKLLGEHIKLLEEVIQSISSTFICLLYFILNCHVPFSIPLIYNISQCLKTFILFNILIVNLVLN